MLARVSPAVAELAHQRDGWTPAAWRAWLLHLANACEALHPDRAAELRCAAAVLAPGLVDMMHANAR